MIKDDEEWIQFHCHGIDRIAAQSKNWALVDTGRQGSQPPQTSADFHVAGWSAAGVRRFWRQRGTWGPCQWRPRRGRQPPCRCSPCAKIIPTPLTPRLPRWDVAGGLPCPSATLQEVGLLSTGRKQTMEFEEISEKDLSPRDGVGCPSPSAALAALPVRPPTPQAARLKMSHPLQRGRGRHLRSLGF